MSELEKRFSIVDGATTPPDLWGAVDALEALGRGCEQVGYLASSLRGVLDDAGTLSENEQADVALGCLEDSIAVLRWQVGQVTRWAQGK